jgi:hypothetical protein
MQHHAQQMQRVGLAWFAPEHAAMTLKEMEDLLGVPKEHLEFTLWYLKESQCVARADNAKFTITLKGVEVAETYLAKPAEAPSGAAMRLIRVAVPVPIDATGLVQVTDALLGLGLDDAAVARVMGGNAIRVLMETLPA